MANILENIIEKTRSDLAKRKRDVSLAELESFEGFEKPKKSFKKALKADGSVSIIAEIKKGSPSKGIIRHDFAPVKIAGQYIENGASALSVLTDEPFFHGSLKYMESVSKMSPIPVLRKDFVVDPYQVKEASAYGADAVLLIATMYEGGQLSELLAAVNEFNLQALVECYHENEVDALNWDEIEILGVNNRDLTKFKVDLHRGTRLLQKAPENIVRVSESGISSPDDLLTLYQNSIHSALIGEHFMREENPGLALNRMVKAFEKKLEETENDKLT